VLTNRLARAVDRARSIEDKLENHTGDPQHLLYDLEIMARRARYLNTAISLSVVSAVMVALVVVTLFANAFFEAGMALTIALLFVGAMLFLTGAFVAFFIEVRVATTSLRIGLPPGQGAARP
jgi:VIT1/CCC1 family predicted Fe2+/Mn2+ transporter